MLPIDENRYVQPRENRPHVNGVNSGRCPAVVLRCVMEADAAVMHAALFYASRSHEEPGVGILDMATHPTLARYVRGWGRFGDLGVVADVDRIARGASWLRLPDPSEEPTSSYVDPLTPELCIAVFPGNEGRGLGSLMLEELLGQAESMFFGRRAHGTRIHPATRLYERFGFTTVGVVTNRVGTRSVKMVLRMASGKAR